MLKNRLQKKLKNGYFSFCIDEATDLHGRAYLAVAVKYLDEPSSKIVSSFYSIVPLKESKKASKIAAFLLNDLLQDDSLRRGCLGFASDSAITLSGKENAVYGLLKRELLHLIHIKDLAHRLANVLK